MDAVFTKHDDPGHGWLEVDEIELKHLDIDSAAFSAYSYRKGHRLFLEEDCDASKFCSLWKAKFGSYPRVVHQHHNGDFPEDYGLYGIHE